MNFSWLIKAAPYILCAFLGAGAVYLYHSAVVSGMRVDAAQERQERAEQEQLDAWVLQKHIEAADEKATKELSDAQKVSRNLAGALAAARKRLSVGARCDVPASSSAGLGSRGIAILDRESEQLYLDHRALIEKKDAQIRILQQAFKSQR